MRKENVDSTMLLCRSLINELGVDHRYDSLGELAHKVLGEISMDRVPMDIYQAYAYYHNFPADDSRKAYAVRMERRLLKNYRETLPRLKEKLGLQGVYIADLHTEGFESNSVHGIARSNSQKLPLLLLNIKEDNDTLKMQMMAPCLFADKLGAYNWRGGQKNLYASSSVINYNDSAGHYFATITNQKINNPHTSTADFLSSIGAEIGSATLQAVSNAPIEQALGAGMVGAGVSMLFQLGALFASKGGVENGIIAVEFRPETADVMFADITYATLSVDDANNKKLNETRYHCRLYRLFSDSEAVFLNSNNGCYATCEYWFNVLDQSSPYYKNFIYMHPASYPLTDERGKNVRIAVNEFSMAGIFSKKWRERAMPSDEVMVKMPPLHRLRTFNVISRDNEVGSIMGDYDKKIKGFKTFMARLDYDGQLILSTMSNGVKDGVEMVYMPDGRVMRNEYVNGVVKQTEKIK